MPSQKEGWLWIRNSSWKRMVCAAIKCILKEVTLLPIRIATHDARRGMGLGDALFVGRVPRNQSGDGLALRGCAGTAKKEWPCGVAVAIAHRDGPCARHCGGNFGSGSRRGN